MKTAFPQPSSPTTWQEAMMKQGKIGAIIVGADRIAAMAT